MDQIPIKGVVLFIAFGTLISILIFCFVKRQITRFTLRSSSVPHAPIGSGAPKELQERIERRLKWAKEIVFEPPLLEPELDEKLQEQANSDPFHFIHRLRAVDSVKLLDAELKVFDAKIFRKPGTPMKSFLLEQRQTGPLEGAKLDLVEKFSTAYDHARHDPKEFTFSDYQQFMDLLKQLTAHVRAKCDGAGAAGRAPEVQTEVHSRSRKAGADSHVLTQNIQYRILPEHGSGASLRSAGVDETTTSDVEMSSQRIANYALAGKLSIQTDGTKAKNV